MLANVDEFRPRYAIACFSWFKEIVLVQIPKNDPWVIEDVQAGVQWLGRHENIADKLWKLLRVLVIFVAPEKAIAVKD